MALALTPETEGIISAGELELMEPHAWLVNVARGRHVVTDDLVAALRDGRRSAAPGSTSPIPSRCPTGHPLWSLPNCIITPARRPTRPRWPSRCWPSGSPQNVRRFARGEELIGPVDPELGY